MGSYLSRALPGPPSPTLSDQDRPEKFESLGPSPFPRPDPLASPVHSVTPVTTSLNPTRKLSYEDLVTSPIRRQHRRQLVVQHRQRFPIQQARCLFLGVLSSASSEENKSLSVSISRMSYPSVILKLASAKGKFTLRLALEQSVLTIWSSLAGYLSIPYANKTLMTSGDQRLAKEMEDYHTGAHDSETPQSAFRHMGIKGRVTYFVPRPGPLKKDICYNSSVKSLTGKSQTFMISCSKRNAITSSYSSTHYFQIQQGRTGASITGFPSLASSYFQTPGKKADKEGCQDSSLASAVSQRQNKHENFVEVPSDQQQNLRICSSSFDLSGPKKRKIPLLLPCRRNDPLILPSPPQLGYQVTAEDLDLEKRAAIQWINKVLKDDRAKTQSN